MPEFNDFLRKLGFSPNEVRLLRHNKHVSSVWRQHGRKAFGCSASFQKPRSAAYKNRPYACHFLWEKEKLTDGDFTGLFVGITRSDLAGNGTVKSVRPFPMKRP